MADGAELVRLELTFWHKDKKPGDIVEVRRDELHQWRAFAKPATTAAPGDEDGGSTPKTDTPAKTATTTAKVKA